MSDPDRIIANLDSIQADLDSISRKLKGMPTKNELWAFVGGFTMGAAFTLLGVVMALLKAKGA